MKAARRKSRRISKAVKAKSAEMSSGSNLRRLENLADEVIADIARKATKNAAARAIVSGRRAAGWRDGHVVEYGLGPLRGTVLRYDQPTDPIADDEWDALRQQNLHS